MNENKSKPVYCPDCKGSGVDAAKTKSYRKGGGNGNVRCWTCNGNGLDDIYYF